MNLRMLVIACLACALGSAPAVAQEGIFSMDYWGFTSIVGGVLSGQGFIPLPALACEFLSSGDMPREGLKAEDYVVREWRGEMGMFAKRQHVPPWQLFKLAQHVPPTFCAAVVYTVDAYCADPQVHPDEIGALRMENATHVLVAVLGSRGPKPTLSSHRFVRNLAGGNLAFADKTQAELVEMAKDVVEYEQNWVTVAD